MFLTKSKLYSQLSEFNILKYPCHIRDNCLLNNMSM